MQCSNPDCTRMKTTEGGFFGRMFSTPDEGYVRDNNWYCCQECFQHPILKDFILRKQGGHEMRTITWPITQRSFGAALVKLGKLEQYQVERALKECSRKGTKSLAHHLLKTGLITRRDVLEALGKHHRVPVATARPSAISPEIVSLVPKEVARIGGIMPFSYSSRTGRLAILMKDPSDLTTILTVRKVSGCHVQPFQGDPVEIDRLVGYFYETWMPRHPAVEELERSTGLADRQQL